ncbi:MAG: PQQ-binding-like beta-propeller repeat protein [Ktedonobacterales bacterium]
MYRLLSLGLLASLFLAGCATTSSSTPHLSPAANTSAVVYGLDANADLVAYNINSGKPIWASPLSGDPSDVLSDAEQGQVLVVGNTVYLLYQYLTAYRATDGKQLWQMPISQGQQNQGQLFLADDTLYALVTPVSTSQLYALNPQNGSLRWHQELNNLPVPSGIGAIPPDEANAATYHNGIIYLATDYGAAALNASNGQLLWHVEQSCGCSFPFSTIVWTPQALLLQSTNASGLSENTNISYASYLLAVDPATGKPLWNNFISNQTTYSAISSTLGLYSITADAINSVNLTTGRAQWSVPLSHVDGGSGNITQWFIGPTALVVVTGPSGGDLVALNAQSGAQLWKYQSTETFATLAVGDTAVYVLGSDGIEAFSLASGKPLWNQNQPGSNQDLQIITLQNQVLVTTPQVSISGPPACTVLDAISGMQLWTSEMNGCAFLYTP